MYPNTKELQKWTNLNFSSSHIANDIIDTAILSYYIYNKIK